MRDVRLHADIPVKPVYGPEDLAGRDPARDIGQPGEYPFTRGIHRQMYAIACGPCASTSASARRPRRTRASST